MSGYCDELFYILLEEEFAKCFDNDVKAPRELIILRMYIFKMSTLPKVSFLNGKLRIKPRLELNI